MEHCLIFSREIFYVTIDRSRHIIPEHLCDEVSWRCAVKDNPYLHLADRRKTIAQLLYAVVSR